MEIIAHRGASAGAPENTLAAALLAWAEGADALEGDVRLSADGDPVLLHDADLARVSRGRCQVPVSLMDREGLAEVDVGSHLDPVFAAERVPTLAQWLATVPPGRRAFVELKCDLPAVAAVVRVLGWSRLAPSQVVVIAFDLEVAERAKAMLSRCEVCWLVARDESGRAPSLDEVISRACAAGVDGLDLEAEWPVDERVAQRVRDAGLRLYVWTVDDAVRARELAALGIDGLTTNRPGGLRADLRAG